MQSVNVQKSAARECRDARMGSVKMGDMQLSKINMNRR